MNGGAIDIAGEQHRIKWEVFTNYGFLNATNCNFINNKAGHDGGALATYWGNSYVYNSVFRQNYADRDGGSVRVGIYPTTLTENCTFDNNTAKEWGGALYNWPGELKVNNCTISNNNAGRQGGAMITSGPLTVTNSKIINNTAVKKGGVVYIAEETPHIPSTVIFENNIIEGNYAKVGSLVYADETTATNTNFNGNSWDIDPTSDEWADAFITNDLIDMPTKFIDSNGNVITVTPKQKATEETIPHVPEEKPDHHEIPEITNQTDTEETNTTNNNDQNDVIEEIKNIPEQIKELLEQSVENLNTQSNSTVTQNSGVGNDYSQNIQNSEESMQSEDNSQNAHEISKKDVAKQSTTSPIPYVIEVIIILAILVYGYSRYNKNDE